MTATSTESYVVPPGNRTTGLAELEGFDNGATASLHAPVSFDSATMMPIEEVRPGMKGYGLSVFSGLRPERFEAEVIGVRHRVFAGMDIILVQLKHPVLTDIGVVAGMSGSPVYMDNKLIGAVAYGWMNSKEALAGVTPIDNMLDVLNSTPVDNATSQVLSGTHQQFEEWRAARQMILSGHNPWSPTRSLAKSITIPLEQLDSEVREKFGLEKPLELVPLAAPIFMSSLTHEARQILENVFPANQLVTVDEQMQSISTWSPSETALNSPGGAVDDLLAFADEIAGGYGLAVPFVEGDLNMSGVGTVTYRAGNRLIAFGHPMMSKGTVRFPMAPARINTIVRSLDRPFKVGEPLGQVGMVMQDRQPAVGGLFGDPAPMVPVKVTVEDERYRGTKEFNFRIFNDRDMSPSLLATTLVQSVIAAGRAAGDSSALVQYSLTFDDGTSVTREDFATDESGTLMAAMMPAADVGMIVTNPYKGVYLDNVAFQVRLRDALPVARIDRVETDQVHYLPGDKVRTSIRIQPYRAQPVDLDYEFNLPENMAPGDYTLTIGDDGFRLRLESARNPRWNRVDDYESLLTAIDRNFPANKIYISMVDKDTGAVVDGSELPKLPASIINTIQGSSDSEDFGPLRGNFLVDGELATNHEIEGTKSVTVRVRKRTKDF